VHSDVRRRGRAPAPVTTLLDLSGLRCPSCGARARALGAGEPCACGVPASWPAPLPGPDELRAAAVPDAGLWRYGSLLPPVAPEHRVTLGEPVTPLVEALGMRFKLDYLLPTGSFKDRGSAILVGCALEAGITAAVADSSGNAGASLAAYCARARIGLTVFVPDGLSPAKLVQTRAYGATVIGIAGGREAAAVAAREYAERTGSFHASHGSSPYFLAGTRTVAFELWQQLGGAAPSAIVVPLGAGTLLLGLAEGYASLVEAGLLQRMPRLYGVQAERFAPLARALRGEAVLSTSLEASIAEGICVRNPPRSPQILTAVGASGGDIFTVDEHSIARARAELARAGLFVEPTSAAAYAGAALLPAELRPDSIVILTGSGLKHPTDGA
jgi:threonine synthase